jgi:23S rRNA pseudouridine955/2504/2580 synthase
MKDIPVLYEDQDIFVVNKPSGIAVQGGEGISVSVPDILERQSGAKVYPVHRLDRDTAGILVVARNSRAASEYTAYFAGRGIEKKYRAVCFGSPGTNSSGIIKLPAGRAGNEKPAETFWRLEAAGSDASLFDLELGTGRMHQIRIHLASIGCPVVADDKYGDFKKNREARSRFGVRKLQLVSYSLLLPVGGAKVRFEIPLPEHMSACLEAFGIPVPLVQS